MALARQIFKLSAHMCYLPCRNYQVTITGAASSTGQSTALLLRTCPSITKLVLHDTLEHMPGIVLDLSHIPSKSKLKGYIGEKTLLEALQGSDLVLVTGGVPQDMDCPMKSILSKNADLIKIIAAAVTRISPLPFFGIATEPLNTLVPMAAEVMKNNGCYDQSKLLGITVIDTLKAQTLYAKENGFIHSECHVPVICGHSKESMVPLLSQACPKSRLTETKSQELTAKLRDYTSFEKASSPLFPTLSVAFSVYLFTQSILEVLDGRIAQVNALVENNDFGTSYFSGLVEVNKNGIGEMRMYADLFSYECVLLEQSIKQLRQDVTIGKKILELV
ncbi:malate dehydrogenase-like [Battus philenor]|uniref:malate dehydrogenase-like n=1 Tax=Battus philenor TaxID=42288 RepID=UPI0035D0BD33